VESTDAPHMGCECVPGYTGDVSIQFSSEAAQAFASLFSALYELQASLTKQSIVSLSLVLPIYRRSKHSGELADSDC
jgi:hypothetical protein